GGVGEARGPVGLLRAQVGEKRAGEPSLDELRHDRLTAALEISRAPFVFGPASAAFCLVGDARVRTDDDEALDEPRSLECQVQATAAAERVADVARLAARLAEGARR